MVLLVAVREPVVEDVCDNATAADEDSVCDGNATWLGDGEAEGVNAWLTVGVTVWLVDPVPDDENDAEDEELAVSEGVTEDVLV